MNENIKNKLSIIFRFLLKNIIIGILVSIIIGTFLCLILWDYSIEYYISSFIGGIFGSILVDVQNFFKEIQTKNMKQVYLRWFLLGSIITLLIGLVIYTFYRLDNYERCNKIVNNRTYKEIVSHCSTKDSIPVEVVTKIIYLNCGIDSILNDTSKINYVTKETINKLTYKEYIEDIKVGGKKILKIRDIIYGSELSNKIYMMKYRLAKVDTIN